MYSPTNDWVQDPSFDEAVKLRAEIVTGNFNVSNLDKRSHGMLKAFYECARMTVKYKLSMCNGDSDKKGKNFANYSKYQSQLAQIDSEITSFLQDNMDTDQSTDGATAQDGVRNFEHNNTGSASSEIEKQNANNNENANVNVIVNENNDGFTMPRNRKRALVRNENECPPQKAKSNVKVPVVDLSNRNRFQILENEKMLNDKTLDNPQPQNSRKLVPKPKIRPITVKFEKQEEKKIILKKLAEDQCNFTIAPAGDFLKIFPDIPQEYEKITKNLEKLNVNYYLIKEKSTYPLKVVIRGLSIDTETEEIRQELEGLNYKVEKVSQMARFKNKEIKMPLFQIHLTNNEKSKEIFNLTKLLYHNIKIENYNRPTRTIQCYRCQYFHHSQEVCKMAPRCVKCAGSHETKDCKKPKEEEVKCCNCNEKHTASYRGCLKFPENRRKFTPKQTNPNFSYANATKNNPNNNTTEIPSPTPVNDNFPNFNSLTEILDEMAREIGFSSYQKALNHLQNKLKQMKSTNDPKEKENIFINALMSQPSPAS